MTPIFLLMLTFVLIGWGALFGAMAEPLTPEQLEKRKRRDGSEKAYARFAGLLILFGFIALSAAALVSTWGVRL